jgi:hypothetical protein
METLRPSEPGSSTSTPASTSPATLCRVAPGRGNPDDEFMLALRRLLVARGVPPGDIQNDPVYLAVKPYMANCGEGVRYTTVVLPYDCDGYLYGSAVTVRVPIGEKAPCCHYCWCAARGHAVELPWAHEL